MILYPAIDLKKGKCVRLLQGNMNKQTIFNNDPLMQAKLFVNEGCEWLHVVDLDGALTQSFVNKKIIKDRQCWDDYCQTTKRTVYLNRDWPDDVRVMN